MKNLSIFSKLEDPRENGKVFYPLNEILFLILVAVLSCAKSWETIIEFGEARLGLLRKYFPCEHGLPSKSTLCTVLSCLNKDKFEKWLTSSAQGLSALLSHSFMGFFLCCVSMLTLFHPHHFATCLYHQISLIFFARHWLQSLSPYTQRAGLYSLWQD